MKDISQLLRDFLSKTVCWNCESVGCNLHYYPNTELCSRLETDIKQFIKGTANKSGSKPPSIAPSHRG